MSDDRGHWIALIGLMGSGKSTVGRALAAALDRPFVDLDQEIERRHGHSVPDLFNRHGESGFRELEARTLQALDGRAALVLACGGGTPLRPENLVLLRRQALIVWLDVDPEVAAARAADGTRPLLQGVDPCVRMRELHDLRAPVYALADVRVDAGGATAAVVAAVRAAVAAHGV